MNLEVERICKRLKHLRLMTKLTRQELRRRSWLLKIGEGLPGFLPRQIVEELRFQAMVLENSAIEAHKPGQFPEELARFHRKNDGPRPW